MKHSFRAAHLVAVLSVILLICAIFPLAAAESKPELSIGIFADADSLPFILCAEEQLFEKEGATVNLVRFQSAVERDSAFQAGAVDGIISDLLAVVLAAQAGYDVRVTSLTDGRYGIVAAPGSGTRSLADLSGKQIGISSNTIIHYMVDQYLTDSGLGSGKVQLLPIPKMPVRLEMLLSGQVAAAGVPEPFLTTALTKGAILLARTDDSGMEAGVVVFSAKALSSKLDVIRRSYSAYWKAAQAINASPDRYRDLLVKKVGFPEEAARNFVFVTYKKPRLPSLQALERASGWLDAKGLLKKKIELAALLDGRVVEGF